VVMEHEMTAVSENVSICSPADADSVLTSGHSTGSSQGHLRGHIDVGHVLILAEEWKMKKNSERARVGGKDNQFADAAVECLGRLVGAFLKLPVMCGLLHEILRPD
jgi:hypothetical protein